MDAFAFLATGLTLLLPFKTGGQSRIFLIAGLIISFSTFLSAQDTSGFGTATPTPVSSIPSVPLLNPPPHSLSPSATASPAASSGANQSSPTTIDLSMLAFLAPLWLGIVGFILYNCGLTRAKNCAHTVTLLLICVFMGLFGDWICGFAVQSGGLGDDHSSLLAVVSNDEKQALNHELGFTYSDHFFGLMGSSGYLLMLPDPGTKSHIYTLFLLQSTLIALVFSAWLGVGLERAKIAPLAVLTLILSGLIFPGFANWVWGGGWLAQLGGWGLGHGVLDWAGSGVLHETAGAMALALALILGPRYGRFNRDDSLNPIPGHNVPLVVTGTVFIIISLLSSFLWACETQANPEQTASLTLVNGILGMLGSVVATQMAVALQRTRLDPTVICRAAIGGWVVTAASGPFLEPWASVVTGSIGGLLILGSVHYVQRVIKVDDPVGAIAVHGAGGVWGLLALGLFANNNQIQNLNQIPGPVQGWIVTGNWTQFVAQGIGCITDFLLVFLVTALIAAILDKIIGLRVEIVHEINGLDESTLSQAGYQPDAEPEST